MTFVCLTPDALDALADPTLPVEERRILDAPPGVGRRPDVAPPPDAKAVYGGVYADHLETENFTINWESGHATLDQAERAGEALEAAWSTFVVDQGWTLPVSGDRYYIWVLLVDDLGGTGLTTEYSTDDFPEGYPVIYLNSRWAGDEAFWRALAEHEFHHALQYAVRPWTGGGGAESWYWEASATWAAQVVEPETVALDYIVPLYGDRPSVRFDDIEGSHQYGMFVLNAWLEEPILGFGAGAMKAAWDRGAVDTAATWDTILADTTGRPEYELWAAFAAAFGNDAFGRGTTWQDPTQQALEQGATGEADRLGTVYYRLSGAPVSVLATVDAGAVRLSAPATPWGSTDSSTGVLVGAGEVLAVTALENGSAWSLSLVDAGDTGRDAAGDTGDTGSEAQPPRRTEPAADCGCASSSAAPVATWLAAAGCLAVRTRRRANDALSR